MWKVSECGDDFIFATGKWLRKERICVPIMTPLQTDKLYIGLYIYVPFIYPE